MPIYEYICLKCHNQFELRRSMNDSDQPAWCPACSSPSQRLISSFACKMGSNIQASEKPFRSNAPSESSSSNVLITPPPHRVELLPSPSKKSKSTRRKKK